MNPQNHIVSGIYSSRVEAEQVRERLVDRGFPPSQVRVVAAASDEAGNVKMNDDDAVLKSVLMDGAAGVAVGTGLGALAEVALVAANVTLFVVSPLVAPLAMLGWGAALGGTVGAALGAGSRSKREGGTFSELVLDAIRSGHVILVADTQTGTEADLAREVIGESILQTT